MPTAAYTQALQPRFILVQGRPWSLPLTWRNPAGPGQPPGSGSPIDLTGATASCTVRWTGGEVACAMAILDASGTPTPSLIPAQTADVPTGFASAHLNITDTAGNTYDFEIGLQVVAP